MQTTDGGRRPTSRQLTIDRVSSLSRFGNGWRIEVIGDIGIISLAALLLGSASAQSTGWQLRLEVDGKGPMLTFNAGDPVSYEFECNPNDVRVTQTGVTKLLDLKTGQPVGDDAQAVMPTDAAMMALFGGKGDPQFIPAGAVKNPAGGWDLTIRLAKGDKQLKAVGKAEMVSLFTTGYTMAVPMDGEARAKWNDFLKRCQTSD